jgi:hypothetical protein
LLLALGIGPVDLPVWIWVAAALVFLVLAWRLYDWWTFDRAVDGDHDEVSDLSFPY